MTRLIAFDLDGTLLNTLEDLAVATNYVLEKHGFPVHPIESYRNFVGNGLRMQVMRALPEGKRDEGTVAICMKEELEYYNNHLTVHTRPYPGVVETLSCFAEQGILLAVVTNKPDEAAQKIVCELLPGIPFFKVQGKREGFPLKPDPAVLNLIIQQAKVCKSEVIYVGDSSVDIQLAKNAGVMGIGALWGFRTKEELEQAGAQSIISKIGDLKAYIVK